MRYVWPLLVLFCACSATPSPRLASEMFGRNVFIEIQDLAEKEQLPAEIVVLDREGHELLRGETDQKGYFLFAPPIVADLTVQLFLQNTLSDSIRIEREVIEAALPKPPVVK